jgi:hypothetical protein
MYTDLGEICLLPQCRLCRPMIQLERLSLIARTGQAESEMEVEFLRVQDSNLIKSRNPFRSGVACNIASMRFPATIMSNGHTVVSILAALRFPTAGAQCESCKSPTC